MRYENLEIGSQVVAARRFDAGLRAIGWNHYMHQYWGDDWCETLYRASEEARSRDLYASQRWSEDNPPRPFRVWARERGLI